MNTAIQVRITKNYGVEAIYPACETSQTLTRLTGKKTFSRDDIAAIKALGFDVKVEAPTL